MSQLGGGIGTRGPGETQLETDRRKINFVSTRSRHSLMASVAFVINNGSAARQSRFQWSPSSVTRTLARARSSMRSPRPAYSNRPACSLLSTLSSDSCSYLPAARSCSPIRWASSATFPTHSLQASAPPLKRSSALKFFSTSRMRPARSVRSRNSG